jgi:glycerol-3-phosphate dehydrogenase subunit B
MRSTNIARVFDKKNNVLELTQILKKGSEDCDAIIFPACIGLSDDTIEAIKKEVSKPFVLIPTLPPSIIGIRTQQHLHNFFIKSGGVYMLGDSVKRAEIDKNLVKKVYSYNHGDIPFTGKNVVLATGSYFSQGLIATQDSIYEPIFGLDTSFADNRQEWYNPDMFEKQGYQYFGVKTNNTFNGLKNSAPIDNLYVAGAILEGFNGIKEGCGAGVSILSALYIADTILLKEHESVVEPMFHIVE